MIEKYTKNEIISAIKYKAIFDINFEPMLISIIQKIKIDKAFADWESATIKSQDALRAFADYTQELKAKYGKVSLLEMSESDKKKYLEIAKKSDEADREQEQLYRVYRKIQNEVLKQ